MVLESLLVSLDHEEERFARARDRAHGVIERWLRGGGQTAERGHRIMPLLLFLLHLNGAGKQTADVKFRRV